MARSLVGGCMIVAIASTAAGAPTGHEPYPKARQLCSEHIAGNSMHISWSTWASTDPVAAVVAHYEKATGERAKVELGAHKLGHGDFKITIVAAAKADELPRCTTKVATGERTVILLSQAIH